MIRRSEDSPRHRDRPTSTRSAVAQPVGCPATPRLYSGIPFVQSGFRPGTRLRRTCRGVDLEPAGQKGDCLQPLSFGYRVLLGIHRPGLEWFIPQPMQQEQRPPNRIGHTEACLQKVRHVPTTSWPAGLVQQLLELRFSVAGEVGRWASWLSARRCRCRDRHRPSVE
jgi:hypothetical protein